MLCRNKAHIDLVHRSHDTMLFIAFENRPMVAPAFQDQFNGNHCFGCGANNPHGLQIKSYWLSSDVAKCDFHPAPHHCAGSPRFLNGGIGASVIDCHAICTAIAYAYQQAGRPIGSGEDIWYVTGEMALTYLRPIPVSEVVTALAAVNKVEDRRTTLHCQLLVKDKICVSAEVSAIRVDSTWMK